ncbi:hypothetical protein [Streptomyces sp. NPDC047315]|uniref:hypothetical protein n=1 Tax=Streptomyces sp. NPDC047315 TaxID=3155142 RepID=UPI0033EFEBF7
MITPDTLRAMPLRERLAALKALSPADRAALEQQMAGARADAEQQYGPADRVSPQATDRPCIDLH